jgi:hypothetical protein
VDPEAALFEEGLVISMRINLAALGIPAIGLPLLLVFACAPKVRPDPISSGGAGGSGGSGLGGLGGSVAEGSVTGAGGGGGSAPMGSCSKAGQIFTILGDAELDGTPKLDDKLYLVPDPGMRSKVHVVLTDNGMNRVLVRTVIDDQSPLGNFSQYGGIGAPSFRLAGARVGNNNLILRGTNGNNVAALVFPVDPDKGVKVDGVVQPLPTPIECLQGGHPGKVAFALGSAPPLYLVTCLPDDPAITTGALFAGDGTGMPTQIAIKDQSAPEMSPGLYSYENGVHLAFFGGDSKSTFFSYGATVDLLGALQPIQLTPGGATLQGVFAMVPLPADNGITLISAFFDTAVGKGQFLAGPTLAKDYATLAKVPPGGSAPIQDIAALADVAPIFFPTWDPTGIYGGGASTDGATARVYWFTRDGKPRVFGQTIYTSPGSTILTASAATLGTLNTLVVWTERDDSANPPKYSVKGQKLICQVKS